jgi:hypothetical protein
MHQANEHVNTLPPIERMTTILANRKLHNDSGTDEGRIEEDHTEITTTTGQIPLGVLEGLATS